MSSQPLTSSQSERLREGIALFNRGQFFDCHEILEAAWLETSGEERTFLQGLILVAVSFHHLRQGNFIGATRLLRAGLEKLCTCNPARQSLDVKELLETLKTLPERIETGQATQDSPAPEIRLLPAR